MNSLGMDECCSLSEEVRFPAAGPFPSSRVSSAKSRRLTNISISTICPSVGEAPSCQVHFMQQRNQVSQSRDRRQGKCSQLCRNLINLQMPWAALRPCQRSRQCPTFLEAAEGQIAHQLCQISTFGRRVSPERPLRASQTKVLGRSGDY